MADDKDDGIIADEAHYLNVERGTDMHARLERYLRGHPSVEFSPTGRLPSENGVPYGVNLQFFGPVEDPHYSYARKLFNKAPEEAVTPQERAEAKRRNFGQPMGLRQLAKGPNFGQVFPPQGEVMLLFLEVASFIERAIKSEAGTKPYPTELLHPVQSRMLNKLHDVVTLDIESESLSMHLLPMKGTAADLTVDIPAARRWKDIDLKPIDLGPPAEEKLKDPSRPFKKGSFFPAACVAGKGPYNRPRRRR